MTAVPIQGPSNRSMPPRKFGKYEVLARLATGGAANIFLARQPGVAGFHKLVCLKTLLPERAQDADFVAMFLDEARLAARLNHPSCVQIYDLGQEKDVYYISMEYIFGETLWNLLTTVTKVKTPLPPQHVAAIIASVSDGLHHAHELKDPQNRPYNLVHRDVSPQNIMITFAGQTKVVDFGIAKAATGRAPTVAGIVKGKFSYMSPEQITGVEVDRRSDIYSLGIVLFECLASRRLYRGDNPEEIARLILEHRAPRVSEVVPEIPAGLDEICDKALSRNPAHRYQTAREMGDAIRNYLDESRFAGSSTEVSKLLEERFAHRITDRTLAYEAALDGTYDESHLLSALDAQAVKEIDLFPEGLNGKILVDRGVRIADAVEENSTPNMGMSSAKHPAVSGREGPGFRIELSENESFSKREPVTVGAGAAVAQLSESAEPGTGPTRVLADAIAPNGGHLEDSEPILAGQLVNLGFDQPLGVGTQVSGVEEVWDESGSGATLAPETHSPWNPDDTQEEYLFPDEASLLGGKALVAPVEDISDAQPAVNEESLVDSPATAVSETSIAPVLKGQPLVEPPLQGNAYSLSTVIAAAALGTVAGIVLGMVLSKSLFMEKPTEVVKLPAQNTAANHP